MKTVLTLVMVSTLALVGCKKKQAHQGSKQTAATAPQTAKSDGVSAAATAPGARRTFLEDVAWDLDYAKKKILRLAKAVPQSKYTWRAHPEVHSLAELFLHIAGAHFGISGMAGHPPPADIKGKNLKKSTTDKKKIIKLLERAFAHAKEAVEKAKGRDLSATKKVYGKVRSARFPFLILMIHQHEHLGQLTAWTRSAGVAKPWVAEERAKMKARRAAMAKKKKAAKAKK